MWYVSGVVVVFPLGACDTYHLGVGVKRPANSISDITGIPFSAIFTIMGAVGDAGLYYLVGVGMEMFGCWPCSNGDVFPLQAARRSVGDISVVGETRPSPFPFRGWRLRLRSLRLRYYQALAVCVIELSVILQCRLLSYFGGDKCDYCEHYAHNQNRVTIFDSGIACIGFCMSAVTIPPCFWK